MMDAELITRLNTLWNPIYPHLAQWIKQWIPQDTGHVLEIGPFSGGIINSLLARRPTLQGLIALSEENAARAIRKSFGPPCPILLSPPGHLPLLPTFNLVGFVNILLDEDGVKGIEFAKKSGHHRPGTYNTHRHR